MIGALRIKWNSVSSKLPSKITFKIQFYIKIILEVFKKHKWLRGCFVFPPELHI